MPTSSRFAVAAHILSLIALDESRAHRSEDLARVARTNPSVVRRLLQLLGKAGLTQSRLGAGGGSVLAKRAADISLADIFRAVEDESMIAMPRCEPDPTCLASRPISALFRAAAARAETAMLEELGRTTLEDLANAAPVEPARDSGA